MTSNILVIEDNQADAELIRIFLEQAAFKHKFFHSFSFQGGINILNENAIDLVLLDLSLDDSIGFNTLKNFVKEAPNVPVVVMTGNNNEVMGIQSVKVGAQDFLVKGDFDSKRLVTTIRYSLQRFKSHAKLKKTAKQLSISQNRYRAAQEMAKFAHWEMDIVSNSMKWTDEMFRIFGFQPNSITPSLSDYISYVHIEDKEKVQLFFEEVIKTGKLNRIEHRILVDGRKVKYLTIQARVNYDEHTNKILLIGSIQDITDRKQVQLSQEGEHQSDKSFEYKEKAFSELGFNIRTPLTSIINLLYLLEKSSISPSQKDLIEGLKTSVNDLSIILNNLMNFSLLVSETVQVVHEDFQLDEFLRGMRKVLQIKADQAKVDLQIDLDPNLPLKVSGDQQKIAQILYNLVVKGISLCEENTRFSVHVTSNLVGRNDIVLNVAMRYRGAPLSEQQLNPSIPTKEEVLENYSLADEISGRGSLGLAIVRNLLKLLNGSLTFEKAGGGRYSLLSTIPLKINKQETRPGSESPRAPLRIMLVEDHALNQIATKKVLTSWSDKVSVDIAQNGLIAFNKFEEKRNYDIILMDLQMPEMNGIEATIKIRHLSKVPIIALTASASKQEEEKCIAIGMDDYLAKPFKPQELYAKIMGLISRTIR